MPAAPHLLLTYDFPPIRGGIARYMAELALRYPQGSLIVSTAAMHGATTADAAFPNRVDRLPIEARRLRNLDGLVRWSRRAATLADESRAAFTWCGNVRPAAYVARWVRRRAGTPYGIIFHGSDVLWLQRHARRSRLKRLMYRALLDGAAVLAPNSHWTRDRLLEVLDLVGARMSRERAVVVPLGADIARFRPGLDSAAARARHALPDGRWLVSMARLYQTQKGIDTGIAVVGALRDEFPDLRYLVLVVGSLDDRPRFDALSQSLGVRDRVHYLAAVPDRDLAPLLGLGEIFLGLSRPVPDWEEGFGIALVEASACGLPVVAGRSGGTADAIRDGETGVLVDARGVEEPTRAVRELLRDPSRGRAMGAAGRAAAERYFNWDRVAADLVRLGDEQHRRALARSA